MKKTKLMILASCHAIGGFETKLDRLVQYLDKDKFELYILLVYPFYKARKVPEPVRKKHREFLSWDGIELIKQTRTNPQYKFIPIVMLTTESQAEMKQKGKQAGATGWIVKPFKPDQLLSVVKKVLG